MIVYSQNLHTSLENLYIPVQYTYCTLYVYYVTTDHEQQQQQQKMVVSELVVDPPPPSGECNLLQYK